MSISTVAGNGESENKIERSDDSTQNRDEEIEGMSLVSLETTEFTAEFTDPAILAAKPAVARIKYTKEELVKLRQAPQSLKRPECFDPAYDIWQFDRKSSDTPSDNSGRFEPEYKRRSNDPRERVRKEQDGIVLSPQRRSFNSGCFVPVKVELQKRHRSDSPLGNKSEGTGGGSGGGPHHMQSHREIPAGARRIGSGRILTREVPWDYQDKGDADAEYGYRRERRDTDRDDRFERRSYGRDNMDKDKEKQHGRGRFGDRRRITNEREEEPEWFSGGPSSQNDTIELRGFDDDTKKLRNKKQSPSSMKRSKERALKNKERQQQDQPSDMKEKRVGGGGGGRGDDSGESDGNNGAKGGAPNARSTPNTEHTNGRGESDSSTVVNHLPTSTSPITTKADNKKHESKDVSNVNGQALDALEAILESKSIPSILTNGIGGDGDAPSSGSRFSRFFKTSSPPKTPFDDEDDIIGGAHSSTSMHDSYLLKTILRDISETKVAIPGDTESSFAPISPAAYTGGGGARSNAAATAAAQHGSVGTTASTTTTTNNQKPLNLIDLLQRNRQNVQQEDTVVGGGVKNLGVPGGKVLSLEELEAKMLQQGGGDPGAARIASAAHKQQQQQQHHQKLHNQQQAQQQAPLNKAEEDMTAFKRLLAQVSGGHAVAATNGPVTNKPPMSILEMLSHSQQQDELNRIAPQMGPLSPNPLPAPHIPNDLIIKLQQVQNHVQQQQRFDMLNKLMNAGMHHGQQLRTSQMQDMSLNQSRELLGRPEAQAILQAMHQRIPSPRELQVHTQNIMQRALIKKKLEEQQENFKKRQEMQQRGQSPAGGVSPAKQTASPTPLAFTPTSVLRKMTAEKDEGGNKDGGKNADSQNKTQQGRPVVGMKNSLSQMTQQQQPQQQSQSQWNVQQQQQQQSLKQPGRAIVKANSNFPTPSQQQQSTQDVQQFFQQQRILNQQQQRHKMSAASGPQSQQATGGVPPSIVSSHHHSQQQPTPSQQQQQQQHNYNHTPHHYHQMNTSHHHGANNPSIYLSNPQSAGPFQTSQNNHLTHQQLRAQHQQQQQPTNQQQPQQQHYNNNRAPQQSTWGAQQQQGMFGQFQNYDSRSAQMGRGGVNGGGGDLSPTSNQLARWFSPDLLERARAGKLPNMPNASHSQHAINLEELERQTAPPVHN